MIRRIKHRIRKFFESRAVILMYHQVNHRKSDPWELAVSPENFDEQLSVLSKRYEVVPLNELVTAIQQKKLGRGKVAITFDDGFADNHVIASPLLSKHRAPATFYVATSPITNGVSYWWEELESIILHADNLPRKLSILLGNEIFQFTFYSDQRLSQPVTDQIRNWTADKPITNERLSLYMQLWSSIKPLPFEDQAQAIAKLREWAGQTTQAKEGRVLTLDELRKMAANPLFDIGAHTVNHAMLSQHDQRMQSFEIEQSKAQIEKWLERRVTGFAYPYGNFNLTSKRVVNETGFAYAVSTENRGVSEHDDVFALPRVQVKNWNEKEFSNNLRQMFA